MKKLQPKKGYYPKKALDPKEALDLKKTGSKNKEESGKAPVSKRVMPLGPKLSFAPAEAYKLLRANLMFSANAQEHCQILGVTSSNRSEGKTTTSINLAYTLAAAEKRVLLIDGDMRLPKVAKYLQLKSAPGLSNLLAGLTKGVDPIQTTELLENLNIITSGDVPPNPSELLGSKQSEAVFARLREQYDYIIIDLPPVNIVSDALALSKICDGFLVVVRQDFTSRRELEICVEQLHYVEAKITGFVMTYSTSGEKRYYHGSRRYYSHYGYGRGYGYGHGYGYGYGYGYGHAAASAKRSAEQDAKE